MALGSTFGCMSNYGFCYEIYVKMTVFVTWFDLSIFCCMQGRIQLVSLGAGRFQ